MKKIKNIENNIAIILILLAITWTFYSQKLIILVSDVFINEVCVSTFCINKPKNWFVFSITDKNEGYAFGIKKLFFNTGYSNLDDSITLASTNDKMVVVKKASKKNKKFLKNICGGYIFIPVKNVTSDDLKYLCNNILTGKGFLDLGSGHG